MIMRFEYFYKDQSESYSFYRIPKLLFTQAMFDELSVEAKVLYGLLLDRIGLSRENGWIDKSGHVYVYFTIESIKRALRCGNTKACRLLKELDAFGLTERKKQGLCKPTIIYVKDFMRFPDWEDQGSADGNSGDTHMRIPDECYRESNNTEINKTEKNETDLILSGGIVDNSPEVEADPDVEKHDRYMRFFYDQLNMETLYRRYPLYEETLDAILELLLEVACTKKKTICIVGDRKPVDTVLSRFMKLNQMHIEYVLGCMKENGSDIRNIKQYLLAALYNAPLTMQSYYRAKVNNDILTKKYD